MTLPWSGARLDVCFTPRELAAGELEGRLAVVVDVLRATSTMAQALAGGAEAIVPAESPADAALVAQRIGRERALLGGERLGLRIAGFDLGNSPAEYATGRVRGMILVLTTTNGTAALLSAASAARTVTASFLNLSAAVQAVVEEERPAMVVCSGREGRFALEDVLLAGTLAVEVGRRRGGALQTNDAGRAAMALAGEADGNLADAVARTDAGRRLSEIGLADDVAWCAAVDRLAVLPELREGRLVAAAGTGAGE